MKPLERFQMLSAQARLEPVPRLDVTQRVLFEIRRAQRVGPANWILPALTGLSAAAAAIVAVLALDAWNVLNDPLAGIFNPLAW